MCRASFGSQPAATAGVASIETGEWITTGKGKDRTTVFVTVTPPESFAPGDEIVFRAGVVGPSGPVTDAIVELTITGPESPILTSGPSDASGIAEIVWRTSAPKRGQPGTATGSYTATVSGLTASGFVWDLVGTAAPFEIR